MAYIKTDWTNGITAANETNLDNIESGVALGNTVFTVGGTADALTVTGTGLTDVSAAVINIEALNNNTGASTLNVDGIGAVSIKKNINEDLEADDLVAGKTYTLKHDGTNWQIDISSAGYWEVIDEVSISTPTAQINLPVPTGYKHIQLRIRNGRTDQTSSQRLLGRFNNDAGNDYAHPAQADANSMDLANNLVRSTYTGGTAYVLDIQNPTNQYKTLEVISTIARNSGTQNSASFATNGGMWGNNTEISSIQLFGFAGNIASMDITVLGAK